MAEDVKKSKRLKTLILTDTLEKARTIRRFLGRQYNVIATDGFLRSLPRTQMGIDIEDEFKPKYITVRGKGKLLKSILKESISARRLYVITDTDIEGEALALHYCELFGINTSSNFRVELNEMTKESIKESILKARPIKINLVNAFKTVQTIGRIFMYKLNPLLWHKIYRGISIRLNQALILKMICEQEKKLQLLTDVSDETIREESRSPLTLKTLMLNAAKRLNFGIGKISMIIRQLYEGVSIDGVYTGLITYYKGDTIRLSSESREPSELKQFLTPNQMKMYELIWNHCNGIENESPKLEVMKRYNDYLLMRKLDSEGLHWIETFSMIMCSMLKRGYIEVNSGEYKPTELGETIIKVLKDDFSTIINVKTIKKIETQIEEVIKGNVDKNEVIDSFYKSFNNSIIKAYDKIGDDLTPKDPPAIETDGICEKCGRKMLLRRSRYGPFLACEGYPECKNTKPYFEYTELKCPKCGERLTRHKWSRGRISYACEHFPNCDFSTWDVPQNNPCDECGSTLFIHNFKDRAPMLYCGNENCPTRKDHPINRIIEKQRINGEAKKQKKAKS